MANAITDARLPRVILALVAITVHPVTGGFGLDDLFSLPLSTLDIDWWGKPAPHAVRFALAEGPELFFCGGEAEVEARFDPTLAAGQWVEGLWQRDVIELFARPSGGPSYLELNLAPNGAWWSCSFERYRVRSSAREIDGVSVISSVDSGRFRVAAAVPRSALGPGGLGGCQINVCAILGDPRVFYSATPPPGGLAPDFHALLSPVHQEAQEAGPSRRGND